jgi:hypothetical protein
MPQCSVARALFPHSTQTGVTPLHAAAAGGKDEVLAALLAAGAPLDAQTLVRVRVCVCACMRVCVPGGHCLCSASGYCTTVGPHLTAQPRPHQASCAWWLCTLSSHTRSCTQGLAHGMCTAALTASCVMTHSQEGHTALQPALGGRPLGVARTAHAVAQ